MYRFVTMLVVILGVWANLCMATDAGSTCKKCSKSIGTSNWVETDGDRYHQECFVCEHCDQQLRGKTYFMVEGKIYDEACHATFVAPRCAHCSRAITTEWIEQSGNIYHANCFENFVAKRCFVCGEIIEGLYYPDDYGSVVCADHREGVDRCHSCGRLLDGAGGEHSRPFDDGRLSCWTCMETAVMDSEDARLLMDTVAAIMAGMGIDVDGKVKLRLVNQQELKQESGGYLSDPLGLTLYEKQSMLFGALSFKNFRVYLLYGLPRIYMIAVLAHELMHVWLYKNGPGDHDPLLCEGSCELAAYLTLGVLGTSEAEAMQERMLQNQDPTYGDGLRRVKEYVGQNGLINLLKYLEENSVSPW